MPAALLDVRDSADFVRGHAPQSVNIPLNELPSRMYELPEKGAAIEVFHDDPQQLKQALELLISRGYQAAATPSSALTETGASKHRLWRPSPILEEALAFTSSPGRAIDLACGSGREAVHLAALGWQVDALDILPDALQKAADLARHNGVTINTIQHDLRKGALPCSSPYDLAILIRYWHRPLVSQMAAALTPGGVLVVESFHPEDAQSKRGAHTVTTEELAEEASGLEVKLLRVCPRNGRTFAQLIAVKG